MDILSDEEIKLLHSPAIFQAKRSLEKKLISVLESASGRLETAYAGNDSPFPPEVLAVAPKISRGENYLGYPWMILDHPRFFTREDVFAVRSFVWWTQGASFTLQLSGKYLEEFLPALINNADKLELSGLYSGINDDPWIHHFGEDNYREIIDANHLMNEEENIRRRGYLKLMRRHSLEHIEQIPDLVCEFADFLRKVLR